MKISELTSNINLIAKYCNIYEEDFDIVQQILIPSVVNTIKNRTGYTLEEMDTEEDLTLLCIKMISSAYENKELVDYNNGKVDIIAENIFNLYDKNKL